jgi:hypothetical protein
MREMKQSETVPMKAFTGRGNARDEETARPRKENACLREANEILKKRWPSSRQGIPGGGVPVHATVSRTVPRYEDGGGIGGRSKRAVCAACKENQRTRAAGYVKRTGGVRGGAAHSTAGRKRRRARRIFVGTGML